MRQRVIWGGGIYLDLEEKGVGMNQRDIRQNLNGSWQQGHFATYFMAAHAPRLSCIQRMHAAKAKAAPWAHTKGQGMPQLRPRHVTTGGLASGGNEVKSYF